MYRPSTSSRGGAGSQFGALLPYWTQKVPCGFPETACGRLASPFPLILARSGMVCRKGGYVAVLVGAAILASCRADVCGKKSSDSWEGACKGGDPNGEGTYTHASGVFSLPPSSPLFPLFPTPRMIGFSASCAFVVTRDPPREERGGLREGGGCLSSIPHPAQWMRHFPERGRRPVRQKRAGGRVKKCLTGCPSLLLALLPG